MTKRFTISPFFLIDERAFVAYDEHAFICQAYQIRYIAKEAFQ
ncbi:hypothetical protein ARMA_2134 [Ardenticatena maritima]|uniref:Uncharacterized protein n=1 Tax=Ardenticatena maritima TaxID=872965 RepID=A0A0M8K9N7_9CHLR|nr:hypothetical protein ARMA_2134 [Ardenticatena maritima]